MIGVILIFQSYASITLACEQALCLGKKKIARNGFFHPFPKQRAFPQAIGRHSLDAFIISPHTKVIHARKHANKLLIQCGSANQEFTDASVHRNEQKAVLIVILTAGFSYPLSPILLPFSLSPYPLPFKFQRLLRSQ